MKLTLSDFLKMYPWEEKYQTNEKVRIDWFWSFDLEISADSLWSYVSDTSRLNQAMGLSEMNFEERDGNLYGKSKNAGIVLEWLEIPWTWIYGEHLISIREYSKGMAITVKAIYHFEKISESKTRFYVYLGWVPRNTFYRLLLLASERAIKKKYSGILQEIERLSKAKTISPQLVPREKESKVENKALLFKITDELVQKKIRTDLIQKLIDFIEYGNELDLYRIRPLEIICPHCRGTRLETGSLYEVPPKANCDVCDIDFENDSENSIEITFHIHPSIRNVAKIFFCSAEPAKKPHIKLQKLLNPNQNLDSNLNLRIGSYKLRVKGQESIGSLEITLINTDNNPRLFSIEETVWDPYILKPAYLFSLQEFHDLFSTESISSDLKLELGLQTIFFTDIVGSSTLYELQGDSKTFIQVQ